MTRKGAGLDDLEHHGFDLELCWVVCERGVMLPGAAVRAQEMNARLTVDVWACLLLGAVRQLLSTLSSDVQCLFVGHPDSGPPTFLLKYLFQCWLLNSV